MLSVETQLSGAIVSWSLSPTRRESLRTALTLTGFKQHLPKKTSDVAALKATAVDLKNRGQIVQALKKPSQHGYELADVDRGEIHNNTVTSYTLNVIDGVVQTGWGYGPQCEAQDRFGFHKGHLSITALGNCLKAIATSLGAVTLYPGTYWLPNTSLASWEPLAERVEDIGTGTNRVRKLTTVVDANTAREVRDALVGEIDKATEKMLTSIAGGLSREAIEARKDAAMQLHGRIKQYEGIFGEALDSLHKSVATVEEVATLTALQGMEV